jgi:hypothetical protein
LRMRRFSFCLLRFICDLMFAKIVPPTYTFPNNGALL